MIIKGRKWISEVQRLKQELRDLDLEQVSMRIKIEDLTKELKWYLDAEYERVIQND